MSGGHFDYKQYSIEEAADSINRLIHENDSTEKDEFGDDIGRHYSKKTMLRFKEAAKTLRKGAAMLERVDYLISGDDSEDSFHRRWNKEVSHCTEL